MDKWIRVNGTPVPQGSKTARVVGNRAVMWDSNPMLKAWRENVAQATWRTMDGNQCDEPVAVTIWFYLDRPKTVKRDRPSVKPDLDKLCRAVLDGITDSCLADDAQVIELNAAKFYADDSTRPGAMIHVRTL